MSERNEAKVEDVDNDESRWGIVEQIDKQRRWGIVEQIDKHESREVKGKWTRAKPIEAMPQEK